MLCELTHFKCIEVFGKDAAAFLQGQLSCDVDQVNNEYSVLGACCNNQGRVISNFRLFCLNEHYYLRLTHSVIEKTILHLKKFAVFSKVEITINENMRSFGLLGNDARFNLPNAFNQCTANNNAQICNVGNDRYEILSTDDFENIEINNRWARAEIHAGIVNIEAETSEQFTPHDIGLEKIGAINFEKGCYQGQEIIARMHYRGTRKQHLYHASSASEPKLNEAIFCEETKVGTVINVAENDESKFELLVTLKDDAADKTLVLAENRLLTIQKMN